MGQYTNIKTYLAVKDMSTDRRTEGKITQQIIIGTPGTLIDVSCSSHNVVKVFHGCDGLVVD
jgi:hypothetical protein